MNLLESEKNKFSEKWWSLIGHHFKEDYMINIYKKLREHSKTVSIYPSSNDIFKQFRDVTYDNTLVCFLTPDPIISWKQNITWQYEEMLIELECFDGLNLNLEDNADYLISQGIIHLSPSLTISREFKHTDLGWQFFIKDVIKKLSESLNKVCFVYEDSTMELLEGIDFKRNKVLLLEPGCFKEINKFLKEEYNLKINW